MKRAYQLTNFVCCMILLPLLSGDGGQASFYTDSGRRRQSAQPTLAAADASMLPRRCSQLASHWTDRLGGRVNVVCRTPFVVMGDLPIAELMRWTQDIIEPVSEELTLLYELKRPDKPVTVFLFQSEASLRRAGWRLFGDTKTSSRGYYKPNLRTIMANTDRGPDVLYHELTHALIGFDFSDAPLWLQEGLATFHESCDELQHGQPMARSRGGRGLQALQRAIQGRRLGRLPRLFRMRHPTWAEDEVVNYAHAQYFCQFLHERDVLPAFYRKVRGFDRSALDVTSVLEQLLPGITMSDLEGQFRSWVLAKSAT